MSLKLIFKFPLCKEIILWIILIGFLLSPSTASSQASSYKNTFIWGIDTGAGLLKYYTDRNSECNVRLFLGFRGGYILHSKLLIGLELSGWLFKVGDLWDPSKGAGLNQSFLYTQYYPKRDLGLYYKFGCGYISYWNNNHSSNYIDRGWGMTLGSGYEHSLNENLSINSFINYSFGSAERWKHKTINTGFGIVLK